MTLYRWLLRLFPARLRREYGAAMEETCARRLDDARRIGSWRYARVWFREIAGLVLAAVSERAGGRRRPSVPHEHSRRTGPIDRMGQELRFAARRLRRSPGFALTAA